MNTELKDKNIAVVGAGKSGIAAGFFCAQRGAKVTLMDDKTELPQVASRQVEFDHYGISIHFGGLDQRILLQSDLVVVSPGVPLTHPLLVLAKTKGIFIVGEIELASWFISSPVIGITGTNGKSTVTTLCGVIAEQTGKNIFCGGNLGTPLIEAAEHFYDMVVCELSSFQLESAPSLRCNAATILNLTPDHLDRYPSMKEYGEAKLRIFQNQLPLDIKVLNAEDEFCLEQGLYNPQIGPAYWFTSRPSFPSELLSSKAFLGGGFIEGDRMILRGMPQQASSNHTLLQEEYSLKGYALKGTCNQANAVAAALLMRMSNLVLPVHIQKGLLAMKPLSHRMEWVANRGGVDFYDDSKGTNVDAVVAGIRKFPVPYALIAGGKDKGGDYAPLALALLESEVRGLVLIGEAASKIAQALPSSIPTAHASSMEEAVQKAFLFCQPGDAVLLSPACSSYDMFRDYLHRAEVFKRAVFDLKEPIVQGGGAQYE